MKEKAKVLFLSHNPHKVHLEFAKQINARIKITPFDRFIKISKKYHFLKYLYPLISFLYSLNFKLKEKIILVDGGSSLYIVSFLKLYYPKIKIIYLDADLFILSLRKTNIIEKTFKKLILKCVDAVISVSEMNKEEASNINVPIEVCNPYPAKVRPIKTERKNYGLYVGRLDPDKNIKRILQIGLACPYLRKMIIIGEGTLEDYVEAKSKKYDKLRYLGPKKDVDRYYSQCKFLIHIPDKDPHPCTTMEAAKCGCFPIISKGVGTKYLFDDVFIIRDPNNFTEINKKIKYILEHEKEIYGMSTLQ
ncbi:hypothetical protein ES703_125060 [subsurface metagenome]